VQEQCSAGGSARSGPMENDPVTFDCWPRSADVTQPVAGQFPGWPRTITP